MTLTYVGAPWCVPCKTFKPTVADVAARLGISVTYYDMQTSPPPVVLRVTAVPTLVVYDDAGRELRRLSGGGHKSPAALTEWLKNGGL